MNKFEAQYKEILKNTLENGVYKNDRTRVGCYSTFGSEIKLDVQDGFPCLTSRKIFFKNPVNEFLWMLNGETNIKRFQDSGVKIWNEWSRADGELGPVYGYQLRNFNGSGFDQLKHIMKQMEENPNSRRHYLTMWNPLQVDDMALPPCHLSHQYMIIGDELNLQFNMRSVDLYLGLPYNLTCYAIWLHTMANHLNLTPKYLRFVGTDCHIYSNQIEAVKKYLDRDIYNTLPTLEFNKDKYIFDLEKEDFKLLDYKCQKHIPAPVAI